MLARAVNWSYKILSLEHQEVSGFLICAIEKTGEGVPEALKRERLLLPMILIF